MYCRKKADTDTTKPNMALQRAARSAHAARRFLASSSTEVLGLGYVSSELIGVGRAALMRELMASIDHPRSTIPGVSTVTVAPALGDAGLEGGLWRKMVVDGKTVFEHIYANPAAGQVRRVELKEDARTEGDLERVTQLRAEPHLHIEVYVRDVNSLERVHSEEPLTLARLAVEQTVTLARAKEAQEQDSSFHGNKA